MLLSKSDYMNFLRHPAWLWLSKNDKEKIPPFDEDTQARFDAGYLFESYAEKLFPDAIKLEKEGDNWYKNLLAQTEEAIFAGEKTILQARFLVGEITCICDVIKFVGKNEIDLFEIKSSSSVHTYHYPDLAFQTIVLEDSGYKVRNISVIHVNSDFVRKGKVKPKDIAKITEVTDKVRKKIDFTRKNIKKAINTAKQAKIPDISPSLCGLESTSDWIEIYKSLAGIKKGDGSIYDIYSPSASLIGKLENAKITKIADIPENFEGLSDKQKWQIKALSQNKIFIDHKKINQFLSQLKYPLYFLDYETYKSVIPYFDSEKPYQQIPFQYSLHVLEKPGDKVRHYEYLHKEHSNPVESLSASLSKNIGPKGSVLVWWESFEKSRNKEMGEMFPDYRKFYHNLNERTVDLITPFFEYYYVDARFGGSASIKDVLPVLVPELSHKNLEITEGGTAQRLWMELVLEGKRQEDKDKIMENLIEYCKLDTFAMVKIFDKLGTINVKAGKKVSTHETTI